MAEILPFVILLLVVHPCATLDVQYLERNSRSNSSPMEDYYFSCSAVGQTLQWSVNKLGLGGFFTGSNAGDLLTSSRPNFTYSSSLLSKEPLGHSQVNFTSVLVVSVQYYLHLEVACRTEAEQEIINNSGRERNLNAENSTGESVFLQHALDIIGDSQNTSLFVCEADGLSMTWHARANYPFVSDDVIGANWLELFTEGEHGIVKEQAILIAHQPRPFVSLLIVTNYTRNTIICGSNQDTVHIPTSSVTNTNDNTEPWESNFASESLYASESPASKISTLAPSIVSSTMITGYGQRINTTALLVAYNLIVVALIATIVTLVFVILKWRSSRQQYNMEEKNICGQPPKTQRKNNREEKDISGQPETARCEYSMKERNISGQPETTQQLEATQHKKTELKRKSSTENCDEHENDNYFSQSKGKSSTENCDEHENDNDFSQSEGCASKQEPRMSTPNKEGSALESRNAGPADDDPDVSFIMPRQRSKTMGATSNDVVSKQQNTSMNILANGEEDKDFNHFDSIDDTEDSQLLDPTKKGGNNSTSFMRRNRAHTIGTSTKHFFKIMQRNTSVNTQAKDGEEDNDSDQFASIDDTEDSQLLDPTKKSGQNNSSLLQNLPFIRRNRSSTGGSGGERSLGNSSGYTSIQESPQ